MTRATRHVACSLGVVTFALLAGSAAVHAEDPPEATTAAPPHAASNAELAKKAQNPIANLISVPFQNNTNFNFGPRRRTQNVLNIQPVIPVELTPDVNLITRWILPVIHQPSLEEGMSSKNGIGDLNPTLFLATSVESDFMVGAGPTFLFPTASDDELGTEKWGAGPAAVVVWLPEKWLVGALINNIWSYAGPSDREKVNQMTLQPFVSHTFADGWYVSSSPIITANWEAERSADTWTVPLGGGFGKVWRLGKLPVNTQVQAFWNAEKPEYGADWTLRAQLQFLFPD